MAFGWCHSLATRVLTCCPQPCLTGREKESFPIRSQNVFKAGGDPTFAVPQSIFDRLLTSPEVEHSTVIIYLFLLRRAPGPLYRLHVGDILESTGVSRGTYLKARDQLQDELRLFRFKDTRRKGVWEIELLGEDGCLLPTFDGQYLRFSETTPAEIEAYYCDRLQVPGAGGRHASDDLFFDCPFHVQMKRKPAMKVTIGGEFHGRYFCTSRRCAKNGGLIEFEQLIAERTKQPALSRSDAARAVRNFIIRWRERQVRNADITHEPPAVPGPMPMNISPVFTSLNQDEPEPIAHI